MHLSRRLFALGTATATLGSQSSAATENALDGAWQGRLTPLEGPELTLADGEWQPFRISISGSTVQVFLQQEDSASFAEIKPGSFGISRVAKSAVIQAIDASPRAPVGESWVESWTFSITMKTNDALSCAFTRQVKNHQAQADKEPAFFTMMLSGELQRVYPDHV